VGGVSGRPARVTGGAILSRARARNGGRHPGPRGTGNLRGLTEERGSWSVRRSSHWGLSHAGYRTDDNRCPLEEGGGERSRRAAIKGPRTRPGQNVERRSARCARGHVLHSVQRPVHVNRYSTPGGQPSGGIATVEVSRSGKPTQVGGTGTGVLIGRTNARLAACHRPAVKRRGPA